MAARKGIDWDLADRTLSDFELAHLFNVDPSTPRRARRLRGLPKVLKPRELLPGAKKAGRKPINDPNYEFGFVLENGKKKPLHSWQRAVLRTLGDACKLCGYLKPPITNHCHHIVPLSQGGLNTIHNAIVLCSRCHTEVHAGILALS